MVIHGVPGYRKVLFFGCQARTDTSTSILEAIYTVPKPIWHNPSVSLSVMISVYGFHGYPWFSRSEAGPFSLAARQELTLVLGFWELHILYPSQ